MRKAIWRHTALVVGEKCLSPANQTQETVSLNIVKDQLLELLELASEYLVGHIPEDALRRAVKSVKEQNPIGMELDPPSSLACLKVHDVVEKGWVWLCWELPCWAKQVCPEDHG